jgi:hypothetical protein
LSASMEKKGKGKVGGREERETEERREEWGV